MTSGVNNSFAIFLVSGSSPYIVISVNEMRTITNGVNHLGHHPLKELSHHESWEVSLQCTKNGIHGQVLRSPDYFGLRVTSVAWPEAAPGETRGIHPWRRTLVGSVGQWLMQVKCDILAKNMFNNEFILNCGMSILQIAKGQVKSLWFHVDQPLHVDWKRLLRQAASVHGAQQSSTSNNFYSSCTLDDWVGQY